MSDTGLNPFDTSVPATVPSGLETLSVEQVLAIERKLRENRAAQHRGEPLPHVVTREEMRAAIQAIRRQRGTMNLSGPSTAADKKAKGGKASVLKIDLEGL